MSSTLPDWKRPHFSQGGGDALLFYVVFGKLDHEAALSSSRYRTAGPPQTLEVMGYGPGVHPEVTVSFREGYGWERFGRENPSLAAQVTNEEHCVVLRGGFKDPPNLNYLRDTIGLVAHALDHGGIAVLDLQLFEWSRPGAWRERIFEPAGPVPRHHVVTLVSADGDQQEWFHTRGLRKFGRPDLSIHGVPYEFREGVIDLFNRFIEYQAFGGIIAEEQEVRIKSLPPGMRCFHRGHLEDPDFNNVHVEIEWGQ
jgi:hypothetical protein